MMWQLQKPTGQSIKEQTVQSRKKSRGQSWAVNNFWRSRENGKISPGIVHQINWGKIPGTY